MGKADLLGTINQVRYRDHCKDILQQEYSIDKWEFIAKVEEAGGRCYINDWKITKRKHQGQGDFS